MIRYEIPHPLRGASNGIYTRTSYDLAEPISERAHHCSGISQSHGKKTSIARMPLAIIAYTLLSRDITHPSARYFA
jgi:hypothetical protein